MEKSAAKATDEPRERRRSRRIVRDAEAEWRAYGTPGFYLSPTQPCRVGLTSVAPTALHVGRARAGGDAGLRQFPQGLKPFIFGAANVGAEAPTP